MYKGSLEISWIIEMWNVFMLFFLNVVLKSCVKTLLSNRVCAVAQKYYCTKMGSYGWLLEKLYSSYVVLLFVLCVCINNYYFMVYVKFQKREISDIPEFVVSFANHRESLWLSCLLCCSCLGTSNNKKFSCRMF